MNTLVEVFTLSGERVHREIFRQDSLKFGRHSSNDLILADPRAPLYCGSVKAQTEVATQMEIIAGPYRLRFTNLSWLDQLPDLPADLPLGPDQELDQKPNQELKSRPEHLISSATLPPTPTTIRNLKPWSWLSSMSLWIWILFNLAHLSYFTFMTSQKHDWVGVLVEFFGLNAILLIPTVALAILSKAINREYRFIALLKIHIGAAVAWSFFNLDFFGLRWIFGDGLRSKIIPDTVHILAATIVLYLLSEIIFDHIRKYVRIALFGIGAIIAAFGLFHKYLPLRDQFQFTTQDNFPLVYPPFETAEITTEELSRIIRLQMSKQSTDGNELKKKLNEESEIK
jgi:hypothetical protein